MRMMINSLKRLYTGGNVTLEKIKDMKDKGTITAEEFDYITK